MAAQATPERISEVKKWLSRGWTLQREIESIMIAKAAAETRTMNITAHHSEKITTKSNSRRDGGLISISDYSAQLDILGRDVEAHLAQITRAIYSVKNETLRLLLINRYLLRQPWHEIALDFHREIRWVYRLHAKAILTIEKTLPPVLFC